MQLECPAVFRVTGIMVLLMCREFIMDISDSYSNVSGLLYYSEYFCFDMWQ